MLYLGGQLEKGESGTEHLQFFVRFANTKGKSYFKKLDKRIHFEQSKNALASKRYCLKEDSRIEGPWEFGLFGKPGRPTRCAELALLTNLERYETMTP